MSYGFSLGKITSESYGLSYIDKINYAGSALTVYYSSPSMRYARKIEAIVLPQINIPATMVPSFPSVAAYISQSSATASVSISGGNVPSTILIFVR